MHTWVLAGVQLLLPLLVLQGNAFPNNISSTSSSVLDQSAMCQQLMNSPNPSSVPWSCLCYNCKGTQGVAGVKGDRGPQGTPGSAGPRGAQGSAGAQGLQGIQGPRGLRGPPGNNGGPGPEGPGGIKGDCGDKGDKGDSGNNGVQGAPGPPGLQGVCPPCKGEKGIAGDTGPAGVAGLKGEVGVPGRNGLNGTKGDKGDVGPQGVGGVPGAKGDLGPQGICNCRDGAQGATGPSGPQGPQGVQGAPGVNGSPGAKGDQGLQGVKGSQGDQGFQGIPGPCTPSMQSSFSALLTVSYPKSSSPVPFCKILHNPHNHFDASISVYTAPTNGTYVFTYQLSVYGRVLVVGLFRNGKMVSRLADDANRGVVTQTVILHCAAGDTVWLQTKNDQSNGIYFDGNTDSTFSGYLMYPDVCGEQSSRALNDFHPTPTPPNFAATWPGDPTATPFGGAL